MGFFDKLFRRVGLEIKEVGNATVVRFQGRVLDDTFVQNVRSQLLGLAEQRGQKELILDFSNVQFMSSGMLGLLISLRRTCGGVRLCSFCSEIHKVLTLLGQDKVFEIYTDLKEALEASDTASNRRLAWSRATDWEAKGEYDKAIAEYNELIRSDPKDFAAYIARGGVWLTKGDGAKSIADYAQAIRCAPDHALAGTENLVLVEKQVCDKAVADFTKAIEIDPQDKQSWCNRGTVRMWNGQYDEALTDYNQALRRDPKDVIALPQRFVAACNARLKKQGGSPSEASLRPEPAGQPRQLPKAYGKEGTEEHPSPPSAGAVARAKVLKAASGEEGAEEQPSAPSARRVAARALVLTAVVYRSLLEQYAKSAESEVFRRQLLVWIDAVGLTSEIEQHEHHLLDAPLGRAEEQAVINGCWRSEGLAVLAWALMRYEVPPYDERVDLLTAADGVGFLDTNAASDLLRSAALRPSSEIDGLAARTTIVHWRLRQFAMGPVPMDYSGYLRKHIAYKPYWLDGLRFVDGDLAIGQKCIADAGDLPTQQCGSTAVERQIAAYWLQGEQEVYSRVAADTILSGL